MSAEHAYRLDPAEVTQFPQQDVLPHVPLERKGVPDYLVDTAEHELQHALALNGKIAFLSLDPDGESLARVTMAGNISVSEIQIGAAGSFATHTGKESGFGSDLQKAHMLSIHPNAVSVSSAESIAFARINRHPPEVRRKAAEILAYLKNVPGSMIPQVMARAYKEVTFEGNIDTLSHYEDFQIGHVETEESIQEKTIIDHLRDGSTKVTYVDGDNTVTGVEIIPPATNEDMVDIEALRERKQERLETFGDIFIAGEHIERKAA